MTKLRRVGVLSLGSFMGIWLELIGLVFGFLYGAAIMLFGGLAGLSGGEDAGLLAGGGFLLGLGIMIGAPILYGVLGFLVGLLYGVFMNIALRITGGLEIDIS